MLHLLPQSHPFREFWFQRGFGFGRLWVRTHLLRRCYEALHGEGDAFSGSVTPCKMERVHLLQQGFVKAENTALCVTRLAQGLSRR